MIFVQVNLFCSTNLIIMYDFWHPWLCVIHLRSKLKTQRRTNEQMVGGGGGGGGVKENKKRSDCGEGKVQLAMLSFSF